MDALVHLSHMPALTRLDFILNAILTAFMPSHFPDLQTMTLRSESFQPIPSFLSQTRLPVVTILVILIDNCPSKSELSSFFAGVQISGAGNFLEDLRLSQFHLRNVPRSEALLLSLEDLRTCVGFSNLRRIRLDIGWNVGLTDNDLLKLTSAWPHLREFIINLRWGWNTHAGITLNGLVRLLRSCRSLRHIALAIDTQAI